MYIHVKYIRCYVFIESETSLWRGFSVCQLVCLSLLFISVMNSLTGGKFHFHAPIRVLAYIIKNTLIHLMLCLQKIIMNSSRKCDFQEASYKKWSEER